MTEQMALRTEPADITVAYECFRDPSDPPVLPMMGGGEQMIAWPDGSTPVGHGADTVGLLDLLGIEVAPTSSVRPSVGRSHRHQ